MVTLSEKARRDGLLALEDDVEALDDEFAQKGIQLVVDGADSELVRAILSGEIDGMSARHNRQREDLRHGRRLRPDARRSSAP